jgi:hypothetical protein
MTSPIYEDQTWLQVQDVPRGADSSRLLARASAGSVRLAVRFFRVLAEVVSRRAAAEPPTSADAGNRHHS